MSEETFTCPVCGDEFDHVDTADRHYDRHDPSEYVATWARDVDSELESLATKLDSLERNTENPTLRYAYSSVAEDIRTR